MNRILILCLMILLLFQTTTLAHKMPEEEMCIGGIRYGYTMGYVKNIYGEPPETEWIEDGYVTYLKYIYSPAFIVVGWMNHYNDPKEEEDMHVCDVFLSDNSLTTPSGFTVGMPYKSVVKSFGEGQCLQIKGESTTTYFYHPKRKHPGYDLYFIVDNKGIITKIHISSQHG